MTVFTYVLIKFILLFLYAILFAMLVRAIMSWFTMGEEGKWTRFFYVFTEPAILPVRAICRRFGWFEDVPVDMPFFVTVVILSIATTVLGNLI